VVVSTALVQHDVDAGGFGYALGQVPGADDPFWPACEELVEIAKGAGKATLQDDRKLHIGSIATGDQFIHAPAVKEGIWSNFKPLCVEMEGAAIAQVCEIAKTPFVAIRAISDRADGTAHDDFPRFAQETAVTSAAIVMTMVKEI